MDDWKDLPAVENEPSRAHPHEKVLHPKFIRDIVFKTKSLCVAIYRKQINQSGQETIKNGRTAEPG